MVFTPSAISRDYLTLQELCERWNCEENDIRRLIVSGRLVPSYVINHVAKKVRFITTSDDTGTYWVPTEAEELVEDDEVRKYRKLCFTNGPYYLLHPEQNAALDCTFIYFSADRHHVQGSGDSNICFMFTLKDGHPLNKGVSLDMVFKNGMVMLSEVERYELEGMSACAKQEMPLFSSDYVSGQLATLNQAAKKFWANADRDDRGTHPTNADVSAWLMPRGFSKALAAKAATIIRPDWAPTGRKPKE